MPNSLRPRDVIDAPEGFAVRERFAAGGMAEVLLAERSDRPGEPVVIKRLLRHLGSDETMVALFRHEIRLMRRLAHRAVPVVLGEGADRFGAQYVVMEHVRGVPLSRAIERGTRLGVGAWGSLAEQLLDALAHVHACNDESGRAMQIVHRDVNPANVLLTPEGDVKLIDFGIASSTGRTPDGADADRGTPGYVAPEVLSGTSVGDARADLFAAAVVLHEAASGARLFGGNRLVAMHATIEAPIEPVSSTRADFPKPLDAWILASLSRDPAVRAPSASAMLASLREALRSSACNVSARELGDAARALAN